MKYEGKYERGDKEEGRKQDSDAKGSRKQGKKVSSKQGLDVNHFIP